MSKKLPTLFRAFLLTSVLMVTYSASAIEFSIEQEFNIRKLLRIYSNKYGIMTKVKRSKGKLQVKVWDNNFFTEKMRLTKEGARLVRKLSHYLCGNPELKCNINLESHHFEEGYATRYSTVKKSQFKMNNVALQILRTDIDPSAFNQRVFGDSKPLKNIDKNSYATEKQLVSLNTRMEIEFIPSKGSL